MSPRAAALVLALSGAVSACAGAPAPLPPPLAPPPDAAGAEAVPPLPPARYLVLDPSVIEATADGLSQVVAGGRRLALRGREIAVVGPAEPEVEGGARAPSWAPGSAARYVFWKGEQLFGADGFFGALHPIAALPSPPRGSFDALAGTGLVLPGGLLVAPPAGAAPFAIGVPAAARALAADGRRALVVTALGQVRLTLDGGASYRDVSADLGGAVALAVRGEALTAVLPGGRARGVSATGVITDAGPALAPDRGRSPPGPQDVFEGLTGTRPLDAALRGGLPLADGGVVIAAHGFVGRLDPRTLRSTSVTALPAGLRDAACTPLRAGADLLLACVGASFAAVIDLDGAPRTERTFDLAGASDLDRFVASGDDAIGYLGPCDGAPPRVPDPDLLPSGEPYNGSRRRSPVFCVRAGRDAWIEHRLDAAEAPDVVTWIPRAAGGAVALLARPGDFLDDRDRVRVRGALRVVSLARSEPPLLMAPFGWEEPRGVDRSLRAASGDRIEGWLSAARGAGSLPVTIDAGGHVRAHAAPVPMERIAQAAGPCALAAGDDGRLWETIDAGRRWVEVEPPPGGVGAGTPRWTCSPVGCAMGSFARLGWTSPAKAAPAIAAPRPAQRRGSSPPPPPPSRVRLSCSAAGPPEGRRVLDSGGFGYTPQPQPRTTFARIKGLGVAVLPWASGRQLPPSGDAAMAWLSPLDPGGVVHRFTAPLTQVGLPAGVQRSFDLSVGYLLSRDGGLEAFATGTTERCLAALFDRAGATRALGACAKDGSVGVDLGDRVVVVHALSDAVEISLAEGAPGRGARRPGPGVAFTLPIALHEVHRTPTGGPLAGFTLGVGVRDGAPVLVVLDALGAASLAPIDADRGTIGAEERLRPLTEAALGSSPGCAPRPGDARVVLPLLDGAIELDPASLRGVSPASGPGVAVLRWSPERACLEAVEIPMKDARFDEAPGPYESPGPLHEIVARFEGGGRAALVLIGLGSEVRQQLSCTALVKGTLAVDPARPSRRDTP